MAASRLYNFYPDRLTAMAFFAVPYAPPNSMTALERNAHFSKLIGFERFGYWFFMAEEGSDKLIENNVRPSEILDVCLGFDLNSTVGIFPKPLLPG